MKILILTLYTLFLASPIFAQNFKNGFLSLDGELDFVQIPSSPELDLIRMNYLIEVKLELAEYNSWEQTSILSKRNGEIYNGFMLTITGDAHETPHLSFMHIGAGKNTSVNSKEIFKLKKKVNLVFKFEKEDNIATITEDGILAGVQAGYPEYTEPNDIPLVIGKDSYSDYYGLHGKIDELRIWTKLRSEHEILQYADCELPDSICKDPDSGLLLYYKFNSTGNYGVGNDSLADDIKDFSLNGFHGDLEGEAHIEYAADSSSVIPESRLNITSLQHNAEITSLFIADDRNLEVLVNKESFIEIIIYDPVNDKIADEFSGNFEKGIHKLKLRIMDYHPGVYIIKMNCDSHITTKKYFFTE